MLLQGFPAELLFLIVAELSRKDLLQVAYLSKEFHRYAVIFIYRDVTLRKYRSAWHFCRTLTAMNPGLSTLVHYFSCMVEDYNADIADIDEELRGDEEGDPEEEILHDRVTFCKMFPICIGRMNSLRCFRYMPHHNLHVGLSAVVHAIANKSALRSLSIFVKYLEVEDNIGSLPDPDFPHIKSLAIDTGYLPAFNSSFSNWIETLLRTHAARILQLSLDGMSAGRPLENISSLPSLKYLSIYSNFLGTSLANKTPELRKLRVPYHYESPPTPLPHSTFQHLEEVEASEYVVSVSGLLKGRPIRSLELDGATFDDLDDVHSCRMPFRAPEFPLVCTTLQTLPESSVSVTRLAIYLQRVVVDDMTGLAPHLVGLEQLKICLMDHWHEKLLVDLGKNFLSQLPRLHTFLLSDAPRFDWIDDDSGRFGNAFKKDVQERILSVWDDGGYCSNLNRASFTALHAWNKVKGDWIAEPYPDNPQLYRNYEE
ncbi:hypothetical protein QCA50_013679 [Cerrena zonata]|uniref:F-box domain-containing protein n=1 Tax=Cerrena zonata TaxID=2478898 RepID=A0AAW0G1B0_9APHY